MVRSDRRERHGEPVEPRTTPPFAPRSLSGSSLFSMGDSERRTPNRRTNRVWSGGGVLCRPERNTRSPSGSGVRTTSVARLSPTSGVPSTQRKGSRTDGQVERHGSPQPQSAPAITTVRCRRLAFAVAAPARGPRLAVHRKARRSGRQRTPASTPHPVRPPVRNVIRSDQRPIHSSEESVPFAHGRVWCLRRTGQSSKT
jgi:hypothetical protein